MAIKTFTTGEVLTAADTNTYLANSGLVFVKSQTIGNGVSSVTVSDAFSATYNNYRIVINGGVASTNAPIKMQLGASTTKYYMGLNYVIYSSGTTPQAASDNDANSWGYVGYGTTDSLAASFDVINPFESKYTQCHASGWAALTAAGTATGIHQVATSYTAFNIVSGGTFTGGTITVYGYRKG